MKCAWPQSVRLAVVLRLLELKPEPELAPTLETKQPEQAQLIRKRPPMNYDASMQKTSVGTLLRELLLPPVRCRLLRVE